MKDQPAPRTTDPETEARSRLVVLMRELAEQVDANHNAPTAVTHQNDPTVSDYTAPTQPTGPALPAPTQPNTPTPTTSFGAPVPRSVNSPPGGLAPSIPWADSKTGRLVERWLPGGARGVESVRTLTARHRFGTLVSLVVLLAAIVTAIVLSNGQPEVESVPAALPSAISAGPTQAAASSPALTKIVVSVVGRVTHPGLVTLSNGTRVADAILAAGGVLPNTDDTALNLARRLTDGEQIYVGIQIPPGASTDATQPDSPNQSPTDNPTPPTGKQSKAGKADLTVKVDLNTATENQLETLPGVGPTTAGRILTWRSQHGRFTSISQLRDVGGIGDARFAKIEKLVTT